MTRRRIARRLITLALAVGAILPLGAIPAGADGGGLTLNADPVDVDATSVTGDLDTLHKQRQCSASNGTHLTLDSFSLTPVTIGASTYLRETAVVSASLDAGCLPGVRAVARVVDRGVPTDAGQLLWPKVGSVWARASCYTCRSRQATASALVPYLGPDAHGARPLGDIIVRTEGWVWDAFLKLFRPFKCWEYNVVITDPVTRTYYTIDSGPCAPGSPMLDDLADGSALTTPVEEQGVA